MQLDDLSTDEMTGENMADYALKQGARYQATITLGLLQSIASNEMVADKLREAGFDNVAVTGSGGTRTATGIWSRDDISGAIPNEITDIKLIA